MGMIYEVGLQVVIRLKYLIVFLLILSPSLVLAEDDFVGDWFSCNLKMDGPPQGVDAYFAL
jgi:hypothetical protein